MSQLRLDVKGALREQIRMEQSQTKKETERLRSDIGDVLHTQLSITQEVNQAKLDSVTTQLMV